MDDTFRLDLEGYDKEYIQDVLNGFLEGAPRRGRKMVEIRMSRVLLETMAFADSYKGVPILVAEIGPEGTVEVVLAPLS
jgi:hypothetical protein